MDNVKEIIQKEIEKIWPDAKKNITKVNKDIVKLVKKGEKNIVDIYEVAKKKTKELVLKTKREELHYELGRAIVPLLTSDQLKNKNILKIYTEIQQLGKKLRSKR